MSCRVHPSMRPTDNLLVWKKASAVYARSISIVLATLETRFAQASGNSDTKTTNGHEDVKHVCLRLK